MKKKLILTVSLQDLRRQYIKIGAMMHVLYKMAKNIFVKYV
jgi:hypothetical protein